MNEISETVTAGAEGDRASRQAVVLITGAAIASEAGALFERNGIKAIYADGYSSSEKLAEIAAENNIDAILVRQGKIDEEVISASPRLRVISKHGSGVDNIDLVAATTRNIPVLRALAANAQSVAELAITLAVTLMKDVPILSETVKRGEWPKTKYVGRDLAGANFGVVGFGEIGRRTARLAQGLGMNALAFDPFAKDAEGIRVTRDLREAIEASDIVSLHCPLTPETRHLIEEERLGWMKPTAFLVNTSRGAVVDEAALFGALSEGRIAGAALDSFEEEPPRQDHPFWALPNLIATPHVGGASRSALRNMAVQSAQHIVDVLTTKDFDRRALANKDLA
ncbi:2-hydroxyacid dehydrogenase [Brucella endophytica]|uniref:2-hydroxyacid dehydrogenase n=1 Tax=Brucella endophytica TaxID=1963359 RepID=A0A916SN46_9HYPH|nr:hydroxyacid dehydrogenase [Brucella endophytica]GGB04589.1 2-hydroxyacid dehydrogenase [Brucella endophytica]